MGLHDTVSEMQKLLQEIGFNLEKSLRGNNAAAQRARITTIQFEKLAKKYRKESIAEGKKGKKAAKKKSSAPKKKVHHKHHAKKKTTKRKAARKR